jgi:hypothetical protein
MLPSLRGVGRLHKRPKRSNEPVVIVPGPAPNFPPVNVAAAVNGGTASASSSLSNSDGSWPASGAIDGDRKGLRWEIDGGWAPSTPNSVNEFIQVDFNTSRTIDTIDIFTLQDVYKPPVEPTPTMTFSLYGSTGYIVQYWNSAAFAAPGANNGDRKGTNWGDGGGWNDGTADTYPDTLQVTFNDTYSINKIDLFSLQDNYTSPVEPTSLMTFSQFGITSFQVQYLSGSDWIAVPGGTITGNNLVWKSISFDAVSTSAVRVVVNGSLNQYSRIVELEAWTTGQVNVASQANGGVATASSTHSGAWKTLQTVSGNNLVWRRVEFDPVTTTKIRVIVTTYLSGYPRIVELEAWSVGEVTAAPPAITDLLPKTGTTVTVASALNFTFNAVPSTQTGGTVSKVELYRGETLVDSEDPAVGTAFTLSDTAQSEGTYTYTIKAYHNDTTFTTKTVNILTKALVTSEPGAGNYEEVVQYLRDRQTLVMAKELARNTPDDLNLTERNDTGAFCGIMAPGAAPVIIGQPITDRGYPGNTPAPYAGLPQIDTTIKPPGAFAAMRFDTPHGSGANTCGDWFTHFGTNFSDYRRFAGNSTYYFQFKYRVNQAFMNTDFQRHPKTELFHDDPSAEKIFDLIGANHDGFISWSSDSGKIVFQTNGENKYPIIYHYAGGGNVVIDSGMPNGDINKQPGGIPLNGGYCSYLQTGALINAGNYTGVPAGCTGFVADTWMTIQFRVELGDYVETFPTPRVNARFTAWMQFDFGDEIQVLDVGTVQELKDDLSKILFFPYQTEKSFNQVHELSQVWYAQLIVAMEKIPPARRNPSTITWRPAPGEVADISQNFINSVGVDPEAGGNTQPYHGQSGIIGILAFGGYCYLPDYGSLGALGISAGGGHSDYFGTGAYVFSLDDRLWKRIVDPLPVGAEAWNTANLTLPDGYPHPDFPDHPAANHTYGMIQPWHKAHGGGDYGSIVNVQLGAIGRIGGQVPGYGYYTTDAKTGTRAKKAVIPPGNPNSYGGYGQGLTWYDSNRGHHYKWEDKSFVLTKIDPRTGATEAWWLGDLGVGGRELWIYSNPFFCPTLDRLVMVDVNPNFENNADPSKYKILTCDPTNPRGFGWRVNSFTGFQNGDVWGQISTTWCDDPAMNKAALFWPENDFITYLIPPAADGGTWTFQRSLPFTGIRRPSLQPGASNGEADGTFNRFIWAKKPRCFLWWAYPTAPVQAISPHEIA